MTIRRASSIVAAGLGVLLATCVARADGLDPASADALAAALGSLQAEAATGKVAGLDPRLGAANASPELNRELYELAGQVLTEITQRAGGDPAAMSDALARGRSDPAAFAATLSPATRERLRALAAELSAEKR
jgi:hypothetical protein